MLFVIVRRETHDVVASLLASGLFMATFAVSGAWLDIGRVDAFALCLLLIALYMARHVKTVRGGLVLGVLAFLAFMAKQSDLLAMAPVLIFLLFVRRRPGIAALLTIAGLIVGSSWALDTRTHGWYDYYVFTELTHQGVVSSVWRTFFTRDLWHVPWVIGLAIFGIALNVRRPGNSSCPTWMFWPVASLGLILSAFVSRLHSGGGEDVLIPAYAGLAILGSMGYAVIVKQSKENDGVRNRWKPAAVATALAVIVVVQMAALHYDPARFVPTANDNIAGRSFVDLVRRTPGPVIVSNHPYYDTLAGKASWAQGEAVHDVLRAGPSEARRDLTASINAFLADGGPTTIFSDNPNYALGSYSNAYFRLTPTRVFSCRGASFQSPTLSDVRRTGSFAGKQRGDERWLVELHKPTTRILPEVGQEQTNAIGTGFGVICAQ